MRLVSRKNTQLLGAAASWFAQARTSRICRDMKLQHRAMQLGTIMSAWSQRHRTVDLIWAWTTWRSQSLSSNWVQSARAWRQRVVVSRAITSRYKRTLVHLAWNRWCFTVSARCTSERLQLEQQRQQQQHMVQVRTLRVLEWSRRSRAQKLAKMFFRWRLSGRPTPLHFKQLQTVKAELTRAYATLSGSHQTSLLEQQGRVVHYKWRCLAMRLAASKQRIQLLPTWLRSVARARRVRIKVCRCFYLYTNNTCLSLRHCICLLACLANISRTHLTL